MEQTETLPEKITMAISFGKRLKPDTQLRLVGKINGKETIRYEGIKTGGIVFETRGDTLEEATIKMKKILEKYYIL